MATKRPLFKDNHAEACEKWQQLTTVQRAELLKQAIEHLALLTSDAGKTVYLFNHFIAQIPKLDEVLSLQGATGESNDLYLSARGKTMVIGTPSAKILPVVGQVIAALLTGNEVILHYPSQTDVCLDMVDILHESGVSEDVLSIANDSQTTVLLHMDMLAQVAVAGSPSEVQSIAAELASSDGILTQVIAVTDMTGYRDMLAPDCILRFVTERVKTVNTTAIGGNATLLELGVDE